MPVKRDKSIGVAVTAEEDRTLRAEARRRGLGVAALLRDGAMGRLPPVGSYGRASVLPYEQFALAQVREALDQNRPAGREAVRVLAEALERIRAAGAEASGG